MDKLQPGQMLGSYRIINQIGTGGMATVYKAYQPSMDRNVAVKVLPGQLAENEEFVKRFQQEARIIARLEHPYILPVFDYGEDNGVAYFVMRYLETGTLKDKMKEGSLSLEEIDRIFTQLADALGYAHAQGVIHRDLKPANALIDSSGNLFLTDFGIAKLLESASPRLTQTDAIMGTPAYISPEQAAAISVDQRSDIYSLGIILYEMVTGRVPFVADTPLAVILKHLSEPLPLPSMVKPDISPSIEQVILKALAKDPDDRFATTSDFVSAWKRALTAMDTIPAASAPTERMPDPVPYQPASAAQTQPPPATTPRTLSMPAGRPLTGVALGCVIVACVAIGIFGMFAVASQFLDLSSPSNPVADIPVTVETPAPATEIPTPARVILQDDFSGPEQTWGTNADSNSYVLYDNNALRMIVYKNDWFVWTTPNMNSYRNVRIEATVLNNGTDQYTAFGLICNQQSDGQSFHYFAVTPAGQYVIARTDRGNLDTFLTNNNQWGVSGNIAKDASSYRLGADCGNGALTLYVNGQQIASIADATYTSGSVGVFVWSAAEATRTDVSFDDFLITELP